MTTLSTLQADRFNVSNAVTLFRLTLSLFIFARGSYIRPGKVRLLYVMCALTEFVNIFLTP